MSGNARSKLDATTIQLDVGKILDEAPVGRLQLLVAFLCGLVLFFDGFNTQAIAFIAPAVSSDMHLTRRDPRAAVRRQPRRYSDRCPVIWATRRSFQAP